MEGIVYIYIYIFEMIRGMFRMLLFQVRNIYQGLGLKREGVEFRIRKYRDDGLMVCLRKAKYDSVE